MACGLVGLPGLIGFGSPQQALTVLGGTIDTSGLANYAFSMPREGVITALAGYMSATAGASLDTTLTVRMQLYQSTTPDNIFSPIPGVGVTFSATTAPAVGQTFNDIVTGLSVPVTAQTRLLLWYTLKAFPNRRNNYRIFQRRSGNTIIGLMPAIMAKAAAR